MGGFRDVLSVFALAVLLTGCSKPAPVAAPAATFPAGPRIVSTVPAATLNLVLIGAGERIVGVSTYDRVVLPAELKDLPVVGDYENMNYEQLLALKPTALVIQTSPARIAARLKETAAAHQIELINMTFDHIADIWPSVRLLAKAAGKEQAGEDAIANAQADLQEVEKEFSRGPRPKVLYVASPKLMLIAGKGTFIDEMITLAGGENVGAQVGGNFPEINREAIIRLAPEVLLVDASEEADMQANDPRMAPWTGLPIPAARSHRVQLVTDGNALMASVNVGKNVRMLAELIHHGEPAASAPGAGP